MDDRAAPATDRTSAQDLTDKIRAFFDVLAQRNHRGTIVVLSPAVSPTGDVGSRRVPVWWVADSVKAVDRFKHVKFLSGNVNPLRVFTILKRIALKCCRIIIAKLMVWLPSFGVAKAVVEGL